MQSRPALPCFCSFSLASLLSVSPVLMMSAGLRFVLPSAPLASIPRPGLQCRLPALASLNGGVGCRRFTGGDPLRLSPFVSAPSMGREPRNHLGGVVCYSAPVSPETLHWVSAVSTAILMFAKGTAIHKSFLVPFFALQAPATVISWINGEYGIWTVFLLLLVRLFYLVPGELELPFLSMLFVIVAPHQIMSLRGRQAGTIISLAIAGYLAFQHFSRIGSLRKAFDQASFISSIAVMCIAVVPCLFLF